MTTVHSHDDLHSAPKPPRAPPEQDRDIRVDRAVRAAVITVARIFQAACDLDLGDSDIRDRAVREHEDWGHERVTAAHVPGP